MKLNLLTRLALGCVGFATTVLPGQAADASAAAAKKIFAEWQDAVLWVSGVAKLSVSSESARDGAVSMPDRERKVEALGTVVEASGLMVTALSSIDPSQQLTGQEYRTRSGGTVKLEASSLLKEVKIILPDGTEVPAEVVMRDADLDLAFLRPKAGSKELKDSVFKGIDLKQNTRGDVTDEAVTLSRMDEVLSRQPAVTVGQIIAVTKKPREFLRATGVSAGCPTFSLEGKLLGIAALRSVKGRGSHSVLVPAADVLELAEQARTAKAPAEEQTKVKGTKSADEEK